jgi:DNA-binding beta-propeller fold protein YncE
MQTQRNTFQWLTLLPIGLTVSVLALLLCAMTACQAVVQTAWPPPHQLVRISTLNYGEYPSEIVVAPNGLAYIALLTGQTVVLDGPHPVTVIDKPIHEGGDYKSFTSLTVQPKTGWVYLMDSLGYVHVISGTQVIASIGDIQRFPRMITANPSSGLVYVINARNRHAPSNKELFPSTVDVISGTRVITELLIGYLPQVIVADPHSARVYIGQSSGHSAWEPKLIGPLGILEGATLITNTFLGPEQSELVITDIAVNAKDGSLYWTDSFRLYYWDGQHTQHQVPLDFVQKYGNGELVHVVVDAKHNLAYASYWGADGNIVAVVREDKVLAELPVGHSPGQIAVDTMRDFVYVPNRLAGTMTVIRGTEVITTLHTEGAGSGYVAVDERRGYVYVSNSDSHTITVFGYDPVEDKTVLWQTFLPWLGQKAQRTGDQR